ncbi:MAG: sugar transferase [Sulfurimonas sp.]|nr:sugar transferase [Sulfurimonas sp.]
MVLILGKHYKLTNEDKQKLSHQDITFEKIALPTDSYDQTIEKIQSYLDTNQVKSIVLNLEKQVSLEVESYLEELDYKGVNIISFGEFAQKYLQNKNIKYNDENIKVLLDIRHNIGKKLLKRTFDVVFASSALIALSPVLLAIAIIIKIKSPEGNVLFTQQRLGLHGKFFRVIKFRTMVPNAEAILEEWLSTHPEVREEYLTYRKLDNDPRIISGIGEFLRRSSLDEFPQFFNVLLGDMSVVGPRPYIREEFYKHSKTHIDVITSVKPGVTGYWQVTERHDCPFDKRVDIDIDYIQKQNLWFDFKIVLMTVKVMLLGKGA